MLENKYRIDIDNLKLIENVCNEGQPDAYESLEIYKRNKMNSDRGPIPNSPLF